MPPVRSVNVERTQVYLPPGTVASGRKCLTDSRGCCPADPVEGAGDCGTGYGWAREWEIPETVYLTIYSTIPAASPPRDNGAGEYAQSLLEARQIFSRVFPLRYMTAEEIGSDIWRINAGGLDGSWCWSQNMETYANEEAPWNGIIEHVTGYPFGQLSWSGNRPGYDGSGSYACGALRGYISTAPRLFDGGITPFGGFLNSGHLWTPGYFNNTFAAYPEPDDSWTFLQGAWDWISKYRDTFCSINTAPPGPPRPRRVNFRAAPLPGRLRLDYEEVSLPPQYPREAWPRPWESGTVYLERPAGCGNWFAETQFWGAPARFVLMANKIPQNEFWQPFCFNEWGLSFQTGDIARQLPEDFSPSGYPWYYIGTDGFNVAGGAGASLRSGANPWGFTLANPCQVKPIGATCSIDPLDMTFYLRYSVFYDVAYGISDQWPTQNALGLMMQCRLRESW